MARYKGESKNLSRIFEALARGDSASDINARSDAITEKRKKDHERGNESELNVKNALSELWYIDNVKVKSDQAGHDKNAHDLQVFLSSASCVNLLDHGLVIPNSTVFVQVKSSQKFMDIFVAQTRRYLEVNLDVNDKLITPEIHFYNKKLILLNGQLSQTEIQDMFTAQLTLMNNHYFERKNSSNR